MPRNKQTARNYAHEYHIRNKERIKVYMRVYRHRPDVQAKISAATARRSDIHKQAVWWYKTLHPCKGCGEADPLVLQFDHLSDEDYGFPIGSGYFHALPTILAEIQKCDIVCANCHIRRTFSRGQFDGHKTTGRNYKRARWKYAKT